MRAKKERDLRDQIERADRVGWPILAIVGIVVVIVLAAVAFVSLSVCTTLHQEPLTLRQQIDRLDISACLSRGPELTLQILVSADRKPALMLFIPRYWIGDTSSRVNAASS